MFKRNITITIIIVAMLITIAFCVAALNGEFLTADGVVTVKKTANGIYNIVVDDEYFANAEMSIAAISVGEDPSVIKTDRNKVAYINQKKADEYGNVTFEFFPSNEVDLSKGLYIAVGSSKTILFGSDVNKKAYMMASVYYTISVQTNSGGAVSPSTSQIVAEGDTITFTITPDSGYIVDEILFDGVPVTLNHSNQYTTPAITSSKTINVTFKEGSENPVILAPSVFAETVSVSAVAEVYSSSGFDSLKVLGKPAAISFGKYSGTPSEYGMVYSKSNSMPKIGQEACYISPAIKLGASEAYLIYFYGKDSSLEGNSYYVRSYAKYQDEYVYSENATVFTLNPVTE